MAKSKRLLRLRIKSRKYQNVRQRGGNPCPKCKNHDRPVQTIFYPERYARPWAYYMCPECGNSDFRMKKEVYPLPKCKNHDRPVQTIFYPERYARPWAYCMCPECGKSDFRIKQET